MTHLCSNIQNVSLLITVHLKYHIFFAPDFSGTCCRASINHLPEEYRDNLKKTILEKGRVVSAHA
jgi:hypothetical protein